MGLVKDGWCTGGTDVVSHYDMTGDGIADLVCNKKNGNHYVLTFGSNGMPRENLGKVREGWCDCSNCRVLLGDFDGTVFPHCDPSAAWIDFEEDSKKNPSPGLEFGKTNVYHWDYSGMAFQRLDIKHGGNWVVCELTIDGEDVPGPKYQISDDPPTQIGSVRVHGSRWAHELAHASVRCGPGQALVSLNFSSVGIQYQCAVISGLGVCVPWYSEQVDTTVGIQALDSMQMSCEGENVLAGFQYEHSESGGWGRFKYICCSSGGAPTVVDPFETGNALFNTKSGLYCPSHRDRSGAFMYQRRSGPSDDTREMELKFDPGSGEWCLGSRCMSLDTMSPIGLEASGFEVTAILDFDGQFEGKGVSKLGMGGGDPAALLAQLKKPTRPKPPKMPKLEVFEPEQPEYAKECKFDELNYPTKTELWEKTVDSHGDHELSYAEGEEELPEGNPCAVAASAGGIFDNVWADGDGKAHDHLDYSAIFGCSSRDIYRDMAASTIDLTHSMVHHGIDIVQSVFDMGCAAAPNMLVAPMGVGAGYEIKDVCSRAADVGRTLFEVSKDIWAEGMYFDMGVKDFNDCNPIQTGFARLFCDIHCVRDAVIRGDMTINRNLKKATDITNKNAQALAKWSTDTTISQTDWLAEKIDYIDTKFTIKMDALGDQVTQVQFAAEAAAQTQAMLMEMQGMGNNAAVTAATRASARRALEGFVATAPEVHPGNLTEAVHFLNMVQKLHGSMSAAAQLSATGKTSAVLAQGIREMQQLLHTEIHTLGMYRQTSSHSKKAARMVATSRAQAMMALDSVWWKLRGELDGYVDAAEEQVRAYEEAFELLAGYRHCSAGFSQVRKAYSQAEAIRVTTHNKLRSTWRVTSNLLGELAALIVDGDVFTSLLGSDCHTEQAEQTVAQVKAAASGMRMLQARFAVGGLPPPDAAPVAEVVTRIQRAYQDAKAGCEQPA